MHYLFETESKLRAFLHNASCHLEPGGFFIGTTIDAERVVARMRTEGKDTLCFGNPFYSI
jgi:mRNA (guanine-N7-)-methyltransferase